MAVYYANDLVFELPAEFKDKTHYIFTLTDDGPSPFNVVIARNPIGDEETLETYSLRLVVELKKALPQFRLVAREETKVAAEPALQLDYRWVNQGTVMHQRQVSFFRVFESRRQVVQVTATSTDEYNGKWEGAFRKMVSSIHLRAPDPPLGARTSFSRQ